MKKALRISRKHIAAAFLAANISAGAGLSAMAAPISVELSTQFRVPAFFPAEADPAFDDALRQGFDVADDHITAKIQFIYDDENTPTHTVDFPDHGESAFYNQFLTDLVITLNGKDFIANIGAVNSATTPRAGYSHRDDLTFTGLFPTRPGASFDISDSTADVVIPTGNGILVGNDNPASQSLNDETIIFDADAFGFIFGDTEQDDFIGSVMTDFGEIGLYNFWLFGSSGPGQSLADTVETLSGQDFFDQDNLSVLGAELYLTLNGQPQLQTLSAFNLPFFESKITISSSATPSEVPVPAALPLMLVGLGGYWAATRRRVIS